MLPWHSFGWHYCWPAQRMARSGERLAIRIEPAPLLTSGRTQDAAIWPAPMTMIARPAKIVFKNSSHRGAALSFAPRQPVRNPALPVAREPRGRRFCDLLPPSSIISLACNRRRSQWLRRGEVMRSDGSRGLNRFRWLVIYNQPGPALSC
jgi:hypothetical protein